MEDLQLHPVGSEEKKLAQQQLQQNPRQEDPGERLLESSSSAPEDLLREELNNARLEQSGEDLSLICLRRLFAEEEEAAGGEETTMAHVGENLSAESQPADLMAEITRLRQERDKNKPLYKGHCPDLDSTSYDVWKRQWRNWRTQTCLTAGQVAHATMEVIRDDNKHKKGLSTLMWRQMADQNQDSLTCEEMLFYPL